MGQLHAKRRTKAPDYPAPETIYKEHSLELVPVSTVDAFLFTYPSTFENDLEKIIDFTGCVIPDWALPIANTRSFQEVKKYVMYIGDSCADIILDFGPNKHIHAHKIILHIRSEYFRNMFSSGMAEAAQTNIKMEEDTFNSMKLIITYLYRDTIHSFENVDLLDL